MAARDDGRGSGANNVCFKAPVTTNIPTLCGFLQANCPHCHQINSVKSSEGSVFVYHRYYKEFYSTGLKWLSEPSIVNKLQWKY